MKLFTTRFFGGTLIVALGLFGLMFGLFSLFPPTNQTVIGIASSLVGVIFMFTGYKYAKDAPPAASKTAVDTLRQAGMLDKDRKN